MTLQQRFPELDNTFDVFMLDQRAQGHTEQTQQYYQSKLYPFVEWLTGQDVTRLPEITPNHIRTYLASMRARGLSGFTVHGAASALRAFFQFLRKGGINAGITNG